MFRLQRYIVFVSCLFFVGTASSAERNAHTDPENADADFAIQGEYAGTLNVDGDDMRLGIQVVALGDGAFQGVGFIGGLPGAGWDEAEAERVDGKLENGAVVFRAQEAITRVRDGKAQVSDLYGTALGTLKRVNRKSETMGAKPPQGAIVLFDGTAVDAWQHRGKPARMTDDGLLIQGAASKQRFQSHRIHIEFRLPYQPKAKGQGRGNSGLYLQGRYEVQMLDSFGLTGEDNECGGIYEIRKPNVNMCFPPLSWQTYDVDFHAAKFDDNGQKTRNARMTVRHNGVLVHDDIEVPRSTRAAPLGEGPGPGFVYLQDHGNPVRYRNIWVEKLDSE